MHQPSNTRPLLCRELVGRDRELEELREVLQQAATGQPQFVVLAGEAGVGKTRLCRAFLEASQAQQAPVLFGQAIPQDQTLPFSPFLDAFRRSFTASPGTLTTSDPAVVTILAPLLRLLPEVAPLLPAVPSPPGGPSTPVQQQQALFHSVLAGLQALAHTHRGPLLLVLEDLHWADETSLELLAFLAQRLDVHAAQAEPSTPLMLLGTYRAEALPEAPALSRLLLRLHAQRQVQEMRLSPLPFSAHWRCVNSILGQPVSEELGRLLFDWDEGNPFFLEELLEAMAASGQLQLSQHAWHILPGMRPGLPPSITAAILERVEQLPAADQEVLAYAAVIGRTFDFPLLAALCGIDERELVGVLSRAMHAQLISEVSHIQPSDQAHTEPERYQFRHALTREAVYDHLLAPERRLRHRAVAETLEQLEMETSPAGAATPATRRDNLAQLLAEHYWLAGLPDKARPFALREAERANQVFAFREERSYLNMAQASLPQDSPERLQLLERLGMLSLGIYNFAEALYWLRLARAGYQRIGQHHQALQVMANLFFVNWFLASPSMPDLLAELESAAEVVFADPDPASRDAETLVVASNLAHYWTVHSQYTRSSPWIKRCFALFESLEDPRKVPAIQLSYITRAWFKAYQHINDFEEGIAEIRHAIDLASQFSLPDVIMIGHTTFAWMLIYWGRVDEAEQVLVEAAELEERSGTLLPLFLLGWQRFFSGDQWEQGMNQLRLGIERLNWLHVSYLAAVARVALAHLLLTRNELPETDMHLQTAQPALASNNEYIYLIPLWWGFARLLRVQGNPQQAQQWYERILNRWKTTEDTLTIIPILLDGIIFYVDTGDLIRARQWLAELQAVMQVTDNPVGAAALLEAQGVLKAAEGVLEEAIPKLRQAVEAWGHLKRRYQQALASRRLAESLLVWAKKHSTNRAAAQAAREEADILLDNSLTVYEDLQIPTGIEAVKALRASTRLEAQQRRQSTLITRRPSHGLTRREMQVLMQLAAGQTNREIATVLNITPGTVELHVSHILAKLGCETRTEAVAHALAQGWVKDRAST
jgi:DNA-binding NarL/FixJ family response regulator